MPPAPAAGPIGYAQAVAGGDHAALIQIGGGAAGYQGAAGSFLQRGGAWHFQAVPPLDTKESTGANAAGGRFLWEDEKGPAGSVADATSWRRSGGGEKAWRLFMVARTIGASAAVAGSDDPRGATRPTVPWWAGRQADSTSYSIFSVSHKNTMVENYHPASATTIWLKVPGSYAQEGTSHSQNVITI